MDVDAHSPSRFQVNHERNRLAELIVSGRTREGVEDGTGGGFGECHHREVPLGVMTWSQLGYWP